MGNPTGKGGAKKGEPSRNPSGRPKSDIKLKELLEPYKEAAVKRLGILVHSDDERVALAAAKEIMDRIYGRAPQTISHTDGEGGPLQIIFAERPLTVDEWEKENCAPDEPTE